MMANASLPVLARLFALTCGSKIDETTPTECRISYWFLRTCPFTLLVIGVVGNILNLIVLSRPRMTKFPSTIFLFILACSDTITLICGLVRSALFHGWGQDIRDMSAFVCATQEYVLFICGIYSIWLMAAISMERMLLAKFPIASRSKITRRNVKIVCGVLLILSALLSCHLPFGKTLQNVREVSNNNPTADVIISKCTYVSAAYLKFYNNAWTVIQLMTNVIIPVIFLIICNGVTVMSLVMQRQRSQRIQPTGNNPTSNTTGRDERNKALTRIVILIAIYFLATIAPHNIFLNYASVLPHDTSDDEIPNLFLWYIITFNIAMSNFAFNFFFYFGSGPMFKRELSDIRKQALKRLRLMFGLNVETATAAPVPSVS